MDAVELKKIIKPLIKQCIREVLMEDGLRNILSEAKQEPPQQTTAKVVPPKQQAPQLNENRKKLLDEIGKSSYMNTKFDPFAGTVPLTEAQASKTGGGHGPLKDVDPSDPGVDISGLLNGSSKKIMKALLGGKAK